MSATTLVPSESWETSAPGVPAAVDIRQISKWYQAPRSWREALRGLARAPIRTPVLQGVDLRIGEGEFFGLLGPNGAGKTTLFRILSTMVLPDAGSVTIGGRDVLRQPEEVRRVLVPVLADERSLFWRLSAVDNLRTFGPLYGIHGQELRTRIREVLDVVDLSDTGSQLVARFSSGMKQRLLIARALLTRPSVLLLDEPTRSLDPISARRFREFLRERLSNQLKCTILLATHDSEEALELCDRVAILHRGRVIAVGAAHELAAEVAAERYQMSIRTDDTSAFCASVSPALTRVLRAEPSSEPGWTTLHVEIQGGLDRVAALLRDACLNGIAVAQCQRQSVPLADVIEHFIRTRSSEVPHA